jgi:hypothetical protein
VFVADAEPVALTVDALPEALCDALPAALRPTFAVPPDLLALAALLGGQSWSTPDDWHDLWGLDVMVSNLASDVRVYGEMDLFESAGAWVQFARTGDHHHFYISCDSTSAYFGHVIEGDDDHPWLENGLLRGLGREPLDLRGALPLLDWLEQWRAMGDDVEGDDADGDDAMVN